VLVLNASDTGRNFHRAPSREPIVAQQSVSVTAPPNLFLSLSR
jgi:hypothetical protein